MDKFENYPFDESQVNNNVNVCIFYVLKIVLLVGDKKKNQQQ